MRRRVTRRQLARLGIAAGIAGAAGFDAAGALASTQSPAEALSSIAMVELLAVFAYEQALASSKLSPRAERALRPFLAHEHQHAAVAARALANRGLALPGGPTNFAQAGGVLAAHGGSGNFADAHDEKGWLHMLYAAEQVAIGAYFAGMSVFGDPALLRTSGEIMAAEAQHTTVLTLLHDGNVKESVPGAFVEGTHGT